MNARMTVGVTMPTWLVDFMRNPDKPIEDALHEIAGTIKQIELNGEIEAVNILRKARIKPRKSKNGKGLYDAFGGYKSGGDHYLVRPGYIGGAPRYRKEGKNYVIMGGVGKYEILDTLKTTDGTGYYWEVLEKGPKTFTIKPKGGSPLTYPVNARVLAGYSDPSSPKGKSGRTYISKFRAYWASEKGGWAKDYGALKTKSDYPGKWEGLGFFQKAVHPAKNGIYFIRDTKKYMDASMKYWIPIIFNENFMKSGLKTYRSGKKRIQLGKYVKIF